MIFLLEYDRRRGELCRFQAFPDADRERAQRERLAIELALRGTAQQREVVLLEAADEATIRRTHRRYFSSSHELMDSMIQESPDPALQ